MPDPKCHCQRRLTSTRAVRGWSGRLSHRASLARERGTASSEEGLAQIHSVGQDARKPRFHLLQVLPQVAPIQHVNRRNQLGLTVAHDHRLGNVEQGVVMGLVGGFGGRHLQHGVPQFFHQTPCAGPFPAGSGAFPGPDRVKPFGSPNFFKASARGAASFSCSGCAIVVRNFEGLHHLRRKLRLFGFEHPPADFLLQQAMRPAELGQGQEAGVGFGPVKHGKLGHHRNFHRVAAREDGLEAVVVSSGTGDRTCDRGSGRSPA